LIAKIVDFFSWL
jgi:hypothetical protein